MDTKLKTGLFFNMWEIDYVLYDMIIHLIQMQHFFFFFTLFNFTVTEEIVYTFVGFISKRFGNILFYSVINKIQTQYTQSWGN